MSEIDGIEEIDRSTNKSEANANRVRAARQAYQQWQPRRAEKLVFHRHSRRRRPVTLPQLRSIDVSQPTDVDTP